LGMQIWLPATKLYFGPWADAGLFRLMVAFVKACGAPARLRFTLICPLLARPPAGMHSLLSKENHVFVQAILACEAFLHLPDPAEPFPALAHVHSAW
jgi:hypothetical protein